ncbi:MAG: ArdC family protein [Dehalococcoidales bacterium]|nr:ArdC family protein [Dehalococcoidales bacterium]
MSSVQSQAEEVTQFAAWLAGALFLMLIGRTVSKMEKNFVNDVLEISMPESVPLRIPQTEAGLHPQALFIEGGERLSPQYRDLVGLINESLPDYSLSVLPSVEVETGERKIDAVMKQLKAGVEGIQDSSQFRLFLTTMSKFHDYSIGNQILIMLQKPDATRVAGFNTWKDMGRWVKTGEKGIAILAPIFPPRATCEKCGSRIPKNARFCPKCGKTIEVEVDPSPRFFRVVYVFDLSQTEGKPLPEFEVPSLTGEANEGLFRDLLSHMTERNVSVEFDSRPNMDPGIKGFYSQSGIWVRPEEPRAQQLKTLIHEIAHYYSEDVFRIPRADAETIAESAAFVVGAHYGFDTGVRSFPYVALWAKDKKVLENNLSTIRRVSTTIMDAIEKIRKGTRV